MCSSRIAVLFLALVSIGGAWTNAASAQIFGQTRIQPSEVRVKIISNFGEPVTVGIFGRTKDATIRVVFDGGRTGPDVYRANLLRGERVVCVWDERGSLLYIANLLVDSPGTLELPGDEEALGAAAGARSEGAAHRDGARSAPAIPRLKIKE